MTLKFKLSSALLLVCLFPLAACPDKATAPYPVSEPALASDSSLGPGDVFDVNVFGEKDLTGTYQVAPDGTIDFPLIGRVVVEGKNPPQLAEELRVRLGDGYLKNPNVSVFVKESNSKKVSVYGQVQRPGTFPYSINMSVVEAITLAGGFTGLAKKNSVRITRKVNGQMVRIIVAVEDIGQGKAPNFILRPGDVVFVDERVF